MIDSSISDAEIDEIQADLESRVTFDTARRDVLKCYDDTQACPGSGKTTLVAAKLLILAKKWYVKHKGICVLTHTNVAKNEIISRVSTHPAGHNLLNYPHFIGTIQEFINRYLGLPLIRQHYDVKRFSETDEAYFEMLKAKREGFDLSNLCGLLYQRCNKESYENIESYISTAHYLNSSLDIGLFAQHGKLLQFSAANQSETYKKLFKLKRCLQKAGIFQYSDMYAFAGLVLAENASLAGSLRGRFPCVFIDEMQDTQQFQDELLNQIFCNDGVCLQRFGDPDQAIFSGNNNQPNQTFNNVSLRSIETSHRYGDNIAIKIRGLSFSGLTQLSSMRPDAIGPIPHTLYLYDDESISQVLPAFSTLVSNCLSHIESPIAYAVGSVGKEANNGLTIKHYWDEFDKKKSAKSFNSTKFIHTIYKCSQVKQGGVHENYKLLLNEILRFLRLADIKIALGEKNVHFTENSGKVSDDNRVTM